MKIKFLFTLFLLSQLSFGQRLFFNIISRNEIEKKVLDSIGFKKQHKDVKSISDEINLISTSLFKKGYLENSYEKLVKENDSTYNTSILLGKKTNYIHIYIGSYSKILNCKETEIIKIQNVENLLNNFLSILEKKGYSLTTLQLIDFRSFKNNLEATLEIKTEKIRTLDAIVINGYDKFPVSHKKQLERMYRKKLFNQDNLKKLVLDFEKIRFIHSTKSPEILFTHDSTKVFMYIEKIKANTFDGYIGFNSEQKKIKLNGYLDLKLTNLLNLGEKIVIYWKNNGSQQTSFDSGLDLPYIFRSPLGIKAQLNIFKQDSTFQNAKTSFDIGYLIKHNSRLYLGYQNTESSNIQNKEKNLISDFENSFLTSQFEYINYNNEDLLFPEKTSLNIKIGIGNRKTIIQNNEQFFTNLNAHYNFYLNSKNIIHLKSQNYYLKSNKYIINELFRFGGIHSIRGFIENSLQGNVFSSILSEYRYKFNNSFYLHSINDFAYFEDPTSNFHSQLTSFGFGFGVITKGSIFNFLYSNGLQNKSDFKIENSIVQISLKMIF